MDKINLTKKVYDKNQYSKVIDTSFNQLITSTTSSITTPTISVQDFFNYYQELFFIIPKFGDLNSHEYLIKNSTNYIGNVQNDELIQSLLEEINQVKSENLSLLQTISNLNK
jgi:hypothetical protein